MKIGPPWARPRYIVCARRQDVPANAKNRIAAGEKMCYYFFENREPMRTFFV